MARIVSMDNPYLAGKPPLLVGDMLVNFGDVLPEKKAKVVYAGIKLGIPS